MTASAVGARTMDHQCALVEGWQGPCFALRCTLIAPRMERWSSRGTAVQLECTLLLLGALAIYGCCRKSIQLIAHAWGWNLVLTPPLSYRRCRCALPSTHIWP